MNLRQLHLFSSEISVSRVHAQHVCDWRIAELARVMRVRAGAAKFSLLLLARVVAPRKLRAMLRNHLLPIAAAACAVLLASCAKKSGASSAETAAVAPADGAKSAAPAAADGARVIAITANDTMKFSVTRIEASPGERLRVTLTNVGALPKATMGHNFVLLQSGVNPEQFVIAAGAAAKNEYFPADRAEQVIAHTRLLGPKETAEVAFTAPSTPGEYAYLCTFPAHYQVGMRGILVVK